MRRFKTSVHGGGSHPRRLLPSHPVPELGITTGEVESTTAGQTFSYTTDSNKGAFDPEFDYVLSEDEDGTNPPSNYCVFRDQSSSDFSVQINRGSSNSGIHV